MALAVTTSPALVVGGATSATTASFDAPAGSLLVAVLGHNHYGTTTYTGSTWTMSNSGAALTWTLGVKRNNADRSAAAAGAAVYTAPVASARSAMTATASISAAAGTVDTPVLSLYVATGADLTTPVGATGGGFSTTNNLTTTGVTLQQAGSLLLVSGMDYSASGTPTSSDLTIRAGTSAGAMSYETGYKSGGAAGSSATGNLDGAGTGAVNWTWVSAEIRAAADTTTGAFLMLSPVCA